MGRKEGPMDCASVQAEQKEAASITTNHPGENIELQLICDVVSKLLQLLYPCNGAESGHEKQAVSCTMPHKP